jgi:hypothetical protein
MIDILSSETRRSEPRARTGNESTPGESTPDESTPDNATPIRKNGEAGQNEGRFFRGVVIFLAISVVFWAVVITLFHFL